MPSSVEPRDRSRRVSSGARSAVRTAGYKDWRGSGTSLEPFRSLRAALAPGEPLGDSRSARKTAKALLPDPYGPTRLQARSPLASSMPLVICDTARRTAGVTR